ncbi:hypothetical protein Tcan_07110 [Toxocara canis]|uniref:Uncharacterized protein n=1 Tax=Toxocara canis TaxID=6265 RepID=A0A0B2VGT5_TOXCA|nr:hypothetical protein Tcan_07110 [Toxocara canis]
MDTVILNAGHSQLEEQLKIAAACGVAEKNAKGENADMDDDDAELAVDDANEESAKGDDLSGVLDVKDGEATFDDGPNLMRIYMKLCTRCGFILCS